MCFGGGGKSAEEMYQEQKVDFGELPSLSTGDKNKKNIGLKPDYKNVKLGGTQARSLINPMGTR